MEERRLQHCSGCGTLESPAKRGDSDNTFERTTTGMSQGTSTGALTSDTATGGITLELRGRDLLLHPPSSVAALDDIALLDTLFGPDEASGALARLTRDRRGRFFRARPMDFAPLKAGLLAAAAFPLHVAFEEEPALPWQPILSLTPRPYQEEALTAWRAE